MSGGAMDKELLFRPRLAEEDVEVPGLGGTVRVRALNRAEVMSMNKMADLAERDLHLVALGMVDPKLSVSEARRWAEASPAGEMEPVTRKIAELSGLLDGAAKEVVKTFRGEPGP